MTDAWGETCGSAQIFSASVLKSLVQARAASINNTGQHRGAVGGPFGKEGNDQRLHRAQRGALAALKITPAQFHQY